MLKNKESMRRIHKHFLYYYLEFYSKFQIILKLIKNERKDADMIRYRALAQHAQALSSTPYGGK